MEIHDKRKAALLYPLLFVLRRILFVITVILFDDFVWLQIATQYACCVLMIIYYGYVWPFENHTVTKLEILNEVLTLFLCYFMLCFTDWVPDSSMRYYIGWLFIATVSIYLLITIGLLLINSITLLKERAKGNYSKQKNLPSAKE